MNRKQTRQTIFYRVASVVDQVCNDVLNLRAIIRIII